jgi:RNA polymerase I-specific transcription initiation factor RRN7
MIGILTFSKAANPLAPMFPISRMESSSHPAETKPSTKEKEDIEEKIRTVTGGITPAETVPPKHSEANGGKQDDNSDDEEENDDTTPRPGYSYRVYKQESDMPKTARKFYETAANLSGLSFKTLMAAVNRTELKLEKWQDDTRRAEYHGERNVEYTAFRDSEEGDELGSDFEE